MSLNNTGAGVIYLGVYAGKITRKVAAGTPDAVKRTNKLGNDVWELTYNNLTGKLVNIEWRDNADYGREIHFVLRDGDETYRLQVPFSGRVASGIVTRLPNVNLEKVIEINIGLDTKKETPTTFSFIRQSGETVKSAYTKDNPNGCPPLTKIKRKGKEEWDDSDMLEFLEKMIKDTILPKLGKGETLTPEQGELGDEKDATNDLPF